MLLLFLILESFSLVLIFNYNNFQRVRYLNSSNQVSAAVYKSFNNVVNYFRLTGINENLARENSLLKNRLMAFEREAEDQSNEAFADSLYLGKFVFRSARVINNSVNKQYNYLTLSQGSRNGIRPDQGIISDQGIVGIISYVSENYSTGISLLNRRLMISGKLKKNDFFGSVSWDGTNYRYVRFTDIPSHAEVAIGDSVVTRSSSVYFPEGILIGTVESFEIRQGESFYTIQVKLAVDFQSLTYVEIIENKYKEEIINLESLTTNDQDLD